MEITGMTEKKTGIGINVSKNMFQATWIKPKERSRWKRSLRLRSRYQTWWITSGEDIIAARRKYAKQAEVANVSMYDPKYLNQSNALFIKHDAKGLHFLNLRCSCHEANYCKVFCKVDIDWYRELGRYYNFVYPLTNEVRWRKS